MLLSNYLITILVTIVSKTIFKPCESVHNINHLNEVRYSLLQKTGDNENTPATVTSGETVDVVSNKLVNVNGGSSGKHSEALDSKTSSHEVHEHKANSSGSHHTGTTDLKGGVVQNAGHNQGPENFKAEEHGTGNKTKEEDVKEHTSVDAHAQEKEKGGVHTETSTPTSPSTKDNVETVKKEGSGSSEDTAPDVHVSRDHTTEETVSSHQPSETQDKSKGAESSKEEDNDEESESSGSKDEDVKESERSEENDEGEHEQDKSGSSHSAQEQQKEEEEGEQANDQGVKPKPQETVASPAQSSPQVGTTTQSEVGVHDQGTPTPAHSPATSVNAQSQNGASLSQAGTKPDAYSVDLNNLTDEQKENIKKFYQKPNGSCSVDCSQSCKSELGGSTQCVSQTGSALSCSTFDDSKTLTCPSGYSPCVQPNVSTLKSFTLKNDGVEVGALEVGGSNFNDCMGLVLAPKNGLCDKEHLVYNLLFTSGVLDLGYQIQVASDKLTFSNLKIKNGEYKVCLFQRYEPNRDGGVLSEWWTKLMEFLNPTHSQTLPLKTVFVVEVGSLNVSD